MSIEIKKVDYSSAIQREQLVALFIEYSSGSMSWGNPLTQEQAKKSIDLLASKSYTTSFLAYSGKNAVGFANCIETISTFAARSTINIHDIAVSEEYRGAGVSQLILRAIEDFAQNQGYYKITLEVLEGNIPAQKSYQKFGFESYQLTPQMGQALFWQKVI